MKHFILFSTIALMIVPLHAIALEASDPEVFVHFANSPSHENDREKIAQYIMTDSHVAGAQLMVPWSAVDRGSGSYNWTFVENAMAPWIQAKKVVGLTFYGVEERTSWDFNNQPATPAYVLDQVDKVRCNVAGQPLLPAVPVYFEKPYVENYKKLINAAIRRFEVDPHVSYIRFGFGAGGESFPASKLGRDAACKKQWEAHGMSFDAWLNYVVDLIDYMGSLQPKTRIFVSFNDFGSFGGHKRGRHLFAETLANRAAEYGFAVGNQGFGLSSKFDDLYSKMRGRTPLYMQTGSPARVGDIAKFPAIIAKAQQLGIQTFELYIPLWLIAKDPSNPYHAKYSASIQAALDSTASEHLSKA